MIEVFWKIRVLSSALFTVWRVLDNSVAWLIWLGMGLQLIGFPVVCVRKERIPQNTCFFNAK